MELLFRRLAATYFSTHEQSQWLCEPRPDESPLIG